MNSKKVLIGLMIGMIPVIYYVSAEKDGHDKAILITAAVVVTGASALLYSRVLNLDRDSKPWEYLKRIIPMLAVVLVSIAVFGLWGVAFCLWLPLAMSLNHVLFPNTKSD